jgi:hypothetical protein
MAQGCAPERSGTAALTEAILADFEKEWARSRIYDDGNAPSFLADLYGEEQIPDIFSSVEDYALVLSKNDSGFEIQVLKMRHFSEVQGAKALLLQRKELLQSAEMRRYLGQRYEDYIASAVIYQKGVYLFLLATGDNDRAIDRIEEIL